MRASTWAFPTSTAPATVIGDVAPISGMHIIIGGHPALTYSIAASVVLPSTIGDDVHVRHDMIGRLLSSLYPPTIAAAIFSSYFASSFWYVEPVVTCFSQLLNIASNSCRAWAWLGTSSGVTSGLWL